MQTDPRVSAGVLAKSHDSIAQSIGLFVLGMTPRMDSLKIPAARLTHVITGAAHLEQFHSSRGLNRKPPRIPRPLKGIEVTPPAGPPPNPKALHHGLPFCPCPVPHSRQRPSTELQVRSPRKDRTTRQPSYLKGFLQGSFLITKEFLEGLCNVVVGRAYQLDSGFEVYDNNILNGIVMIRRAHLKAR